MAPKCSLSLFTTFKKDRTKPTRLDRARPERSVLFTVLKDGLTREQPAEHLHRLMHKMGV
eukprot:scaffold57328_cov22-Cyclotella_meneghiniana.AAC.1